MAPQAVAGFVHAFTGSHRYVLDYLVEEVLDRKSASVPEFLLDTCVLDQLTGELCDALTRRSRRSRDARGARAGELSLSRSTTERRWFRCRRLFAEALYARLQFQDAARTGDLSRAAAGASYSAASMPASALTCATAWS